MSKLVLLFMLFFNLSFALADAYKCRVNGKIIYSDHPCGKESKAIEIVPSADSQDGSSDGSDFYSVESQLERLEKEKAELNLEKREKAMAEEQRRLQKEYLEADRKVDKTECNYYQSRVAEEERNLRKGYRTNDYRQSDEDYLNLLRKSAAEYCR